MNHEKARPVRRNYRQTWCGVCSASHARRQQDAELRRKVRIIVSAGAWCIRYVTRFERLLRGPLF